MKLRNTLWIQILFWLVVPLFTTFLWWIFQFTSFPGIKESQSFSSIWHNSLDFNLTFLLIGITSFYITYLFPFSSKKKGNVSKNWAKRLSYLVIMLLIPLVILAILSLFSFTISFLFRYFLYFGYFSTFMFAVAAIALGYLINWIRAEKALIKADHYATDMELALLKSQLSPHFLFNTINNIDALINTSPERASEYLNKLAELLRFMLYDTQNAKVKLIDELSYVQKYIALQRIRSANPNYVYFDLENTSHNWDVPPFLFLPIIENAFKHCSDKSTDGSILIKFTVDEKQIIFMCSNIFKSLTSLDEKGGIGVPLIKRRLEILYPGKHSLQIEQGAERYQVILKLYQDAD